MIISIITTIIIIAIIRTIITRIMTKTTTAYYSTYYLLCGVVSNTGGKFCVAGCNRGGVVSGVGFKTGGVGPS